MVLLLPNGRSAPCGGILVDKTETLFLMWESQDKRSEWTQEGVARREVGDGENVSIDAIAALVSSSNPVTESVRIGERVGRSAS